MGDPNSLTLEKLRIEARLREVETVITSLSTTMKERMSQSNIIHQNLQKLIESHEQLIFGDGGNPGLKIQVDRIDKGFTRELKDHTRTDKWMFSILITLLIAILGIVTRILMYGP